MSSEAKNSGELLSINIDKPLSAGTLEVYLQNGGKNPVYYWGYESSKMLVKNKGIIFEAPPVAFGLGCPSGYLSNGNGRCCNFFNGQCIDEPTGGGDGNPTPPPPPPVPQGCPAGYLPNGQGMCCNPGTGQCVSEGSNGGGSPTVDNHTTPTPIPPVNLENVAQGCPSGYLPNGQGMCCNPGTGSCITEKAIHDPTNSNFVSSFIVAPRQPPCAIWVCSSFTTQNSGDRVFYDCGWLEYQCPTPPPPPPSPGDPSFPQPTPTPPSGCGPDFTFNGIYCVPNNPNSGLSSFTPIPYTGTGTSGTGSGSGSGGNNTSNNNGCPAGTFRNTSTGTCEANKTIDKSGVTISCLVTAVNRALSSAPPSDFITAFNQLFTGSGNFNLNFVQQPHVFGNNGTDEVAAQCGTMVDKSVTIKLNTSALPGMSANYQIVAVLHEMMHAYMQAKGQYPDHEQLLGEEYFDNLLFEAYRNLGLSVKNAVALGLYGCGDLIRFKDGLYSTDSPNYMGVRDKYNLAFPSDQLTIAQVTQIGDLYSNTTRNAQKEITKLGSGNCP